MTGRVLTVQTDNSFSAFATDSPKAKEGEEEEEEDLRRFSHFVILGFTPSAM